MSASTDELIDGLVADMRPVARHAVLKKLIVSAAAGALIALALVAWGYGFRSDLATAFFTGLFWRKWAFVLSFAVLGLLLCRRLARPDTSPGRLVTLVWVPFILLLVVAGRELAIAPPEMKARMWLGESAPTCPWSIGLLSLPLLLAVLSALRQLAPTHLRWAGFSAGLFSGALAAFVYGLHCPESTASFIVTWYTLGMLLPAMVGAFAGPRLLRW